LLNLIKGREENLKYCPRSDLAIDLHPALLLFNDAKNRGQTQSSA